MENWAIITNENMLYKNDDIKDGICEMECNILCKHIDKQELIEYNSFETKESNNDIELYVHGYNITTDKYHIHR